MVNLWHWFSHIMPIICASYPTVVESARSPSSIVAGCGVSSAQLGRKVERGWRKKEHARSGERRSSCFRQKMEMAWSGISKIVLMVNPWVYNEPWSGIWTILIQKKHTHLNWIQDRRSYWNTAMKKEALKDDKRGVFRPWRHQIHDVGWVYS